MESSYLDSYEANVSTRPTGAIPTVRPTQPGIYNKPLSFLNTLSPTRTKTTTTPATTTATTTTSISSAEKRVQDWEAKKLQFMTQQRRADHTMRSVLSDQHQAATFQIPPSTPEKIQMPQQTTPIQQHEQQQREQQQQQQQREQQPERNQAPSPSTPRGIGQQQFNIRDFSSPPTSSVATVAIDVAADVSKNVNTSKQFGTRVGSMYTNREERKSARKKKREYMRQLDAQVSRSNMPGVGDVGTHSDAVGIDFSKLPMQPNQIYQSATLPTTAPSGSYAAKRLSAEEYRTELDRQVQAKLMSVAQEVRPRSQPQQPQQPMHQSVQQKNEKTSADQYRADLDEQIRRKEILSRESARDLTTSSTSNHFPTSSATTTTTTPATPPRSTNTFSPRRLSPKDYRSELDRQVENKLAALRREVEHEKKQSLGPSSFTSSSTTSNGAAATAPSQRQHHHQMNTVTSTDQYRADLDAQIRRKEMLSRERETGMFGDYQMEMNKPSSAPLHATRPATNSVYNNTEDATALRVRAQQAQYRADLDAQVRAKSANSSQQPSRGQQQYQQQQQQQLRFEEMDNDTAYRSAPSGSRAHNLHGMGYDHVLPHLGDEEAERMLSKQRQVSYKNDLDRLVEMRNKREQAQQAQQAQQPQMSQMSQMPHVSARTASSRVSNGSSAPEREYNVNYDNNMLSRLGNHHQSHHPTEQPPNFGRGLSSMHTGKRDLDGEEYARMKQLQYRLELESQMEEQKIRQQEIAPTVTSGRASSSRGSQNQYDQINGSQSTKMNNNFFPPSRSDPLRDDFSRPSFTTGGAPVEFAGLSGLGSNNGQNRNVRLGARVHLETETPEILHEQQLKRHYESQRKENYAQDLRIQMEERRVRVEQEKKRATEEDARLSRKVQYAYEEESSEKISIAQKPISQGGLGLGLPQLEQFQLEQQQQQQLEQQQYLEAGSMSESTIPPVVPALTISTATRVEPATPSDAASYPSYAAYAADHLKRGSSPTGLVHGDSGDLKWKGFTRFKQKSNLDPQEIDNILRKQSQQERTAEALRAQINEKKQRDANEKARFKMEEAKEETRIERERKELSDKFAKQRASEKSKREKQEAEANGGMARASTTDPVVQQRPTTADNHRHNNQREHVAQQQSPPSIQRSSSAPIGSPQMTEEHLLFRREMQYKQNELERQLEEQQTLVKRMSDQMEVALQQQQMGQYPSVTQSQLQQQPPQQYQQYQQQYQPPLQLQQQQPQQQLQQQPQQPRRQWNVAPPLSSQQPILFKSVDSSQAYDDLAFQEEFQRAYANTAMGYHQEEQIEAVPTNNTSATFLTSSVGAATTTAATTATAATTSSSNGLPPRPTPSVAPSFPRRQLPAPVDPAFASRPKIMNSLDERQLREEIDGVPTEHDAVREFDVHYDEYGRNILEESLSGRSKLVQLKESSTMHTWNDGPLVKTAKNSAFTSATSSASASAAVPTNTDTGMPPRPMSGSPTRKSTAAMRKSGSRRSRNWDVEKSLASSSKLIFMKGSLPSIDELHPTGGHQQQQQQQQQQQRPGTAGSLKSVQPAAPTTTTIVEESGDEQERSGRSSLGSSSISIQNSRTHNNSSNTTTTKSNKEETVSDLPSIAWDENAPPANHPMGAADIPTATPPKQQQQMFQESPIRSIRKNRPPQINILQNEDSISSSPAMKAVADFLGVDPTSPHGIDNSTDTASQPVQQVQQDQQDQRPPQTPPRNEFGHSPSQFRVQTPTQEDRRAMERTVVGDLLGEKTLGSTMASTLASTMSSVVEEDYEDADQYEEVDMGKATMKYVKEMNLANGQTVLERSNGFSNKTIVGEKGRFGVTKQWDTQEVIAL